MKSLVRRLTVLFICGLMFGFCLSSYSDENAVSRRSVEDTLQGLQQIVRQGNLSFQQIRDLNEAIARLQVQVQKKSLSQEEQEVAGKLEELVIMKAEAEPKNRIAQLSATKILSLLGDPIKALTFLKNTRANSAEDIEWPLLACMVYLQLGDYSKAGIYASAIDKLLSKQTPLSLSVPVLVDQVQSFRLYTPYSGGALKPGDTLILYIEVDGARFKVQQRGMYACNLEFALELRDELQNVIERQDNYGKYAPEYNGPIQDLHATIYYRIPQGLDGGNYTLIISCTDRYGKAIADTDFVFDLDGKKRIKIPVQGMTANSKKNVASPNLLLEKAKSGDFADVMDLLDDDLGELGKDPYDLKQMSKDEVEKNKLKAAEIMLERSKTQGSLLNK